MTTASTTVPTIAESARNLLRDYPVYFERVVPMPIRPRIRLQPMLAQAGLEVRSMGPQPAEGTPLQGYEVDYRNGLLSWKADPGVDLYVSGFHYTWFLDEDLAFFADFQTLEHLYGVNVEPEDLSPEQNNVIAMGTVVYALYSLLTQFATEIDVSDPEGMFIPAHQRFQQLMQLLQYWTSKYEQAASMLNVGLNRMDVVELRRTARLTNRLVPMFESQEVDDPRPPLRVFPPIPEKSPVQRAGDEDGFGPPVGTSEIGLGTGWFSLGTNGG